MEKKTINRSAVFVRVAALAASICIATSVRAAAVFSALPDLSHVSNYAVFGDNVNLANVTVNGDIGVANKASTAGYLNFMGASTVNGDIYLSSGVTKSSIPSGYTGTIYQPSTNATTARAELFAATDVLKNLSPDYTYTNLTTNATVAGTAGKVTVINITGNLNLSDEFLTLTDGANSYFVVNVFGDFILGGGSGGIVTGGSVAESNVLVNIVGTGTKVKTSVNNVTEGSMLLPYRAAELHSVNGAVWGGDLELKLMSDAVVNGNPYEPPVVVPVPAAVWGGLALCGLMVGRRGRARVR